MKQFFFLISFYFSFSGTVSQSIKKEGLFIQINVCGGNIFHNYFGSAIKVIIRDYASEAFLPVPSRLLTRLLSATIILFSDTMIYWYNYRTCDEWEYYRKQTQ